MARSWPYFRQTMTMTLSTKMVVALVLMLASINTWADDITRHTPTHNNLFVVRADRKLRGAHVEILSATGEVITAQQIQKRKMIIDFKDVQLGTYTIRVSKGDRRQEFLYVKR